MKIQCDVHGFRLACHDWPGRSANVAAGIWRLARVPLYTVRRSARVGNGQGQGRRETRAILKFT
jgi:hypothetical protein